MVRPIGIGLLSLLLLFTQAAKAEDTYSFTDQSSPSCELKKLDPTTKAWVRANASDLDQKTIQIAKDYPNVNAAGFKVNGQWYSSKKFCLRPSQGSAYFVLATPLPNECTLKKFQGGSKTWSNTPASEIGNQSFTIEKTFANSPQVGFRVDGKWYSINKSCLSASSVVPKSSGSGPFARSFLPFSVSFGYRKTNLNLSNGTSTYLLDHTWTGLIIGLQGESRLSSAFALHFGGDVELGVSTIEQDSSVSAITYKLADISTFGARGRVGLAWALGRSFILDLEGGVLLTYGSYTVPDGYSAISSLNTNINLGLGAEIVLGPKSRLKLDAGILGSTSLLFLEGGIEFNVL